MNQCLQILADIWGSTSGNFRVFYDPERDPKKARKLSGDLSDPAFQNELMTYNQMCYGVYFVVNHGGHTDAEITQASAIMIDLDKSAGLPSQWHTTPHIITQRGDNFHAYWLTHPTSDMQAWSTMCKRLIAYYNSDVTIHNPSRVMRLPEFVHWKDVENPSTYQLIYRGEHPRYNLPDLAVGLPEVAQTQALSGPRGQVLLEATDQGTVQRATTYLDKAEPAVEGDNGDQHTFSVAARLNDFGIPEELACELMLTHWNPRCEPPWQPDELAEKVANAYRYCASPQGSANPIAGFLSAQLPASPDVPQAQPEQPTSTPPVPQPTVSGTDPYDVTPGLSYGKNHTENACAFLQQFYPANTLRVVSDNWYYYDGRAWVETTEAAIKRAVATAMMNAAPSNSEISGTVSVLASFVTQRGALGTFQGRDTRNLVLLQNGILDAATGRLEPHNREFFSTNILPFSYDASATCPNWDAFLQQIFDGDPERVRFVQEWLGYMMVRDYQYQKIAMFIGVQRSGKTLISNIAKHLVGDVNYMGIGLEGFAQDGILESAVNKTVLWVGDAGTISGPNRSLIVDRLKTIRGRGDLAIGRKWKSAFFGALPGRISITCNNVLSFHDDSGALADTFVICPFNRSFLGREDPGLENRLAAELPGIANRCLAALRDLRDRGRFVEPTVAADEREAISHRYSPVKAFLAAECVVDPTARVHSDDLFSRYQAWATRERIKTVSRNMFIDSIRSALRGQVDKRIVSIDGVKRQGFHGVGLLADDTPNNVSDMFGKAGV